MTNISNSPVAIARRGVMIGLCASAVPQVAFADAMDGDDVTIGSVRAPITMIEYGAVTCPHCREFHDAVWPRLKTRYVDTGRVLFIFRELPVPPPSVAVAQYQIARCGGVSARQYMRRLGELFAHQPEILSARDMADVEQRLLAIGRGFGLSTEHIRGCIADADGARRVSRIFSTGRREYQVAGAPTLILNGQKLDQLADPSIVTFPGLSRRIEALEANRNRS